MILGTSGNSGKTPLSQGLKVGRKCRLHSGAKLRKVDFALNEGSGLRIYEKEHCSKPPGNTVPVSPLGNEVLIQ